MEESIYYDVVCTLKCVSSNRANYSVKFIAVFSNYQHSIVNLGGFKGQKQGKTAKKFIYME